MGDSAVGADEGSSLPHPMARTAATTMTKTVRLLMLPLCVRLPRSCVRSPLRKLQMCARYHSAVEIGSEPYTQPAHPPLPLVAYFMRRTPGTMCSSGPPAATSVAVRSSTGACRRIPCAIVLNDT